MFMVEDFDHLTKRASPYHLQNLVAEHYLVTYHLDVGAILIIVAIVLSSARNTFDLLGLKTKEPDFWVI